MKALLLLGGTSSRFWPLKEKPLFSICGKTLLEHQLERLKKGGIDDVLLIGSTENLESIQKIAPDLPTVTQDPNLPGMAGALLSALPTLEDQPVLLVGGNDVLDPSAYKAVLDASEKVDGALLAQRRDSYFPGGYIDVKGDKIVGIIEKPGEGNEPSDMVNIVAHAHKSSALLLERLKEQDCSNDDAYERALDTLFASHTFHAAIYDGPWQAVKYPWHLLDLLPLLLSEICEPVIHESVTIHETAVVEGNVIISEGCKIFPHATVRGPCYIGPNSIVANGALLRNASIEERCIVGFNTEVKESIFQRDVWTHMTYVGDSVIGENVSFGAGTITGNLRLDEKEIQSVVKEERIGTGRTKLGLVAGANSRFGINVSLNPGVKVGGGSFIATASVVSTDIPDRSFAQLKCGNLEVRENTADIPVPESREKYKKAVE